MKMFTRACLALLVSGTAWAGAITPTYTSFGDLAAATFGGSGISNDYVAITNYGGVTLGLTATPRFAAPAVGNNGAGTFYATPGISGGLALWNFDFYAHNAGVNDVFVELLYDFDPGAGTDSGMLGSITSALGAGATGQNSWNLGFAFLAAGFPPVNAPGYLPFDPNAVGEYSFALILRDANSTELARSAINVNVGTVPDAASTAGLLLAALAGAIALRRRRG
jgi:MYXO-CTERM domain-containing protein